MGILFRGAPLPEARARSARPRVTDSEANRLWIGPGLSGDLVPAEDPAAIGRAPEGAR